MKKLNLIALLLISGLIVSSSAYATTPNPDQPGIVKKLTGTTGWEPTRVYKLVRNASRDANTSGIVSRDVTVYSTISDDGVTVTLTLSSADTAVAGIAVTTIETSDATGTDNSAQADYGRRNWGWIQVHGPTFARVKAGGANGALAGDAWITSRDLGAITAFPTLVSNANSITVAGKSAAARGGFFFDDVAAADTQAEVFVNLE